ncbi:hypothetical protein L873DRAFT_1810784 [Choiromyces venosus 120613-1]|uniref:Uncharacterized protein n=1 Tax=Choiromyces venosus 120613-1 TaxID=1336337 RepID=A0A3N4JEQ2_9PEZI|nr:hypothetical protein L873DRAFT_1810784 [Choiromyces venosus 120613-1]
MDHGCDVHGLTPAAFQRHFDLMLIPHMGRDVILSFDPVVSYSIASWDRAVHSYIEMHGLSVAS